MALWKGEELLDQLRERLRKSDAVDIAVAWATQCPAVDALRGFSERGGNLRIVVGLDRNVTDPKALWQLYDFGELRIGTSRTFAGGIFHPKYYCFLRERGSTVWIGSANLTRSGFGRNEELMSEAAASASAREWFESLWRSLAADPRKAIEEYQDGWRPPTRNPRPRTAVQSKPRRDAERLDATWSWDDFVHNLRAKDEEMLAADEKSSSGRPEEPFSVFGEYQSWLATINVGRQVTRLPSWRSLNQGQTDVLLGRDRYGALGTLRGAGTACSLFLGGSVADKNAREEMRRLVRTTAVPDVDIIQAGTDAMNKITRRRRIGVAVATRLLALTRPDCYVSVNGESKDGLAACAGLSPTTLKRRYAQLLDWVHGSRWYAAPRPSKPSEQEIWDYRAALVDVFVYNIS